MTTNTLNLLEQCGYMITTLNNASAYDVKGVDKLLEDLEAAIAAERSKEQEKPQQEPSIYISFTSNSDDKNKHIRYWTCDKEDAASFVKRIGAPMSEFYTSPQPLKPLSDVEIEALGNEDRFWSDSFSHRLFNWFEFARAIEAKLGVGK